MTDQIDLFGHSPAQGSLFGAGDGQMRVPRDRTTPDPNEIRQRLSALLQKAKNAETMPWSDRDARMWQTVFPNMAKWLPADEAAQLRFQFEQEIERLSKAA